jgi:subtilisin family serine protease
MGKASAAIVVIATALLVTSAGSAATRGVPASGTTYTVAFTSGSLPANVDKLVADAGGTIVVRLPQIGGLGVLSSSSTFAAKMSTVASVAAAERSIKSSLGPVDGQHGRQGESQRSDNSGRHGGKASGAGADPQPEPDSLGSQQWDKMRMNVSLVGSYAVSRGRSDVKVALTDTGVDQSHPDIAPNLDVANSRSFVPYEPTIQDFNGHGTWTASAVGAPINGIGISGVAPNVSLVELKTNDTNGDGEFLYLDEAIVYAGDKHFDVLSSSIIAYAPVCKGGPVGCDNADYILAQRAVDYARTRGVTIVAALGNDNLDLSDRAALGDIFATPGGVAELPGTLDGVIGVSSTGYFNDKAFYSSYGLGSADVAAPGGDSVFQTSPASYTGEGRLVGAWSSTSQAPADQQPIFQGQECFRSVCAPYAWMQGTSMAAPNAAGVAALIVSRYGDFSNGQNGNNDSNGGGDNSSGDNSRRNGGRTHMSPDQVEQILLGSAASQSCSNPRTVVYDLGFPYDSATCQGGPRSNGFYGAGIVNAFAALTGNVRR